MTHGGADCQPPARDSTRMRAAPRPRAQLPRLPRSKPAQRLAQVHPQTPCRWQRGTSNQNEILEFVEFDDTRHVELASDLGERVAPRASGWKHQIENRHASRTQPPADEPRQTLPG